MVETVYKIIEDCEVKKVGDRQYEFTASTSDIDRDGEVISADGWDLKNFKKNPVIMFAHDYRSLPVGKAPRVWVSSTNGVKRLKNTIQFPPEGTYEFADIVERLVDTGYLSTESVGFIPKEWQDGDGEKAPRRTYTKQELLEISIVPVPSNPNALRNAVNDGVITTKQLETLSPPETDEPKKPKEISQEEIKDEIDYLATLIDEVGLNDSAIESLKELMKRLPGDDIPVEDKTHVVDVQTLYINLDDQTIKEIVRQGEQEITYQEIQEAIKRIANKTEVK